MFSLTINLQNVRILRTYSSPWPYANNTLQKQRIFRNFNFQKYIKMIKIFSGLPIFLTCYFSNLMGIGFLSNFFQIHFINSVSVGLMHSWKNSNFLKIWKFRFFKDLTFFTSVHITDSFWWLDFILIQIHYEATIVYRIKNQSFLFL